MPCAPSWSVSHTRMMRTRGSASGLHLAGSAAGNCGKERPMKSVRDRYAQAAQAVEPKLCCPVEYDRKYLAVIPEEVITKDYGCGDPSRYVREGETVLDLG